MLWRPNSCRLELVCDLIAHSRSSRLLSMSMQHSRLLPVALRLPRLYTLVFVLSLSDLGQRLLLVFVLKQQVLSRRWLIDQMQC